MRNMDIVERLHLQRLSVFSLHPLPPYQLLRPVGAVALPPHLRWAFVHPLGSYRHYSQESVHSDYRNVKVIVLSESVQLARGSVLGGPCIAETSSSGRTECLTTSSTVFKEHVSIRSTSCHSLTAACETPMRNGPTRAFVPWACLIWVVVLCGRAHMHMDWSVELLWPAQTYVVQ